MRIAVVQMDVAFARIQENLDRVRQALSETSHQGATLTIFPECVLTGYCFESIEEAQAIAQSIPGPATEVIADTCNEHDAYAVIGMVEQAGPHVFNAAVLVGPRGVIGSYRKVHLPFLGLDKFSTYGDRPFAVHDVGPLRVGMNICFDVGFPEAARILALQGADLIALPTNWPPGGQCMAEYCINSRALENNVYYAAANRIGTERGFRFIGRSRICDPSGRTMAVAPEAEPAILYADIDPTLARNKHLVRVPGKHEIDRLADRRPEMYGLLTVPHSLMRPGGRA